MTHQNQPRNRCKRPRSRHWCFTINNQLLIDNFDANTIDYLIAGNETGQDGTQHLQGYVCFNTRQYLSGAKKIFPRAHLEIMRGTTRQAVDYCKKDGDWKEWGEEPLTARMAIKKYWLKIYDAAKEGRFEDIPKSVLIQRYHSLKRIHQDNPIVPDDLVERDNTWIIAPSGYGKSTYAREKFPNFYDKDPTIWYVGYKEQPVILLDDFGPDQFKGMEWYLKRMTDKFPYPIQSKGGGTTIRPQHIVVTSQYEINECFPDDPLMQDAMHSRFNVLRLTHWRRRAAEKINQLLARDDELSNDDLARANLVVNNVPVPQFHHGIVEID